jgi:hypothetical protein
MSFIARYNQYPSFFFIFSSTLNIFAIFVKSLNLATPFFSFSFETNEAYIENRCKI